jgi:hypothetical protein
VRARAGSSSCFVDNRRRFERGSIDADTRYFYARPIGAIRARPPVERLELLAQRR